MDVKPVHKPEYLKLIQKHPELLIPRFKNQKSQVTHFINTGSNLPCKAKVRPLPAGSKKAILGKKAWDELIELGIVEPVDLSQPTTWSSPLHLQLKSNGQYRPCGDFRLLNLRTVLDGFPLPSLRSFTDDIKGSRVFSKLDIMKAYHHVDIHPPDRHKTAVLTPWGAYQFRKMAMGLSNSAQSWQRYIQDVLKDIENCYIYLDDILLYSKNEEDHKATLTKILQRLDNAGLTLSLDKCSFGQEEIDFLGFHVNSSGITPIQAKLEVINNAAEPETQKKLLGFLGAISYYRHCLPPLTINGQKMTAAEILQPLYSAATKKLPPKTSFKTLWSQSPDLIQSFKNAKELLMAATRLTYPDPSKPLAITGCSYL